MKKFCFFIILTFLLLPQNILAASFGGGANLGLPILPAPVPMPGIDLFYAMGDLHLGITAAQGSQDVTSLVEDSSANNSLTSIDKFNISAQLMGLEARLFLLFGMNVVFGMGQSNVVFDYSISDTTGGNTAGKIEVKSTYTKLGFGTTGRFGLIYLGLDLLGVLAPISSDVSSTLNTSLPVSGSDLENLNSDLKKTGEDFGKSTLVSFAILRLGILL